MVTVHGFRLILRGLVIHNSLFFLIDMRAASGDRPDVLAADQAQPVESLVPVQRSGCRRWHAAQLGVRRACASSLYR